MKRNSKLNLKGDTDMAKRTSTASAVLVLSLVAFGGAALAASAEDDSFNKVSAGLYEKAKQEGSVIIYSVWDVEHLVKITEAFSKRFPGIKTSYWQGRNPEIVTRVVIEFQANNPSVDAILSDNAPPVIRAAGAIMPYETVQKNLLILHDPTMPVVSLQIQTLSYNTKKLKAADAPKTWEDVANAKYKGMVALDDPMRAGPLSSMLAGLKGLWKDDARWTKFVQGLKALNVPLHKSTSAMMRLLVAGEYAIGMPTLLHDTLEEKETGSPIDYAKTAPPIVFPRYAGIYAKAPHPNAAKLLTEWLISIEGQRTLDAVGRESSRKGFRSKASIDTAFPKGTRSIPVEDKLFLEDPKKWLDTNVKPIWGE
ncbi:MAG: extracellular solute-binding protein [Deltaproteobacteria bacterium]|nr:MAG: extracellular solute-binding protein [Deltaproteobacteria bacterium]